MLPEEAWRSHVHAGGFGDAPAFHVVPVDFGELGERGFCACFGVPEGDYFIWFHLSYEARRRNPLTVRESCMACCSVLFIDND